MTTWSSYKCKYLGFLAMLPQTQTAIFSEALVKCKFWVSRSTSLEAFYKFKIISWVQGLQHCRVSIQWLNHTKIPIIKLLFIEQVTLGIDWNS